MGGGRVEAPNELSDFAGPAVSNRREPVMGEDLGMGDRQHGGWITMGYKNTVDHGLPGVKSAKDERGSAGRWRPRRPGDRVAFVTSSYGALAPSYPHEMMYPGYSGTVRDVGLIYTVIELDGGSRSSRTGSC